ncbi:type II secretion system minor pseudopilin GspK [Pseudomonas indica]|uniref:type II secretion system minor pseudopilin GspK n=1 Tax=Pseudomonas indica TaxID=137658 RepID=UPI0023F9997B|nr:type II secretion system minor pseudopilin GspK [Pseudomonas indica]MBU3057171.1 type II secretion system minor pseudopilin GspK [Pseudomonas indica]
MRRAQRGVALITVLLVVAIVTVVCAGLIARQQLAIRSTSNQMQARQAWHYALGGEALAQAILSRDLKAPGSNPQQPVDHLREAWAKPLPVFPIDQGEIAVRIEDPTGRFNLNNLVQQRQLNQPAYQQFQRLLMLLGLQPGYADRLVDWLDADQEPRGEQGAEDNQYLLLDPPYRTANRELTDVSELRLLLGMSDLEFRRLAPYVTALPAGTALNVNTASAMVLATLVNPPNPSVGEELVAGRREEGYRDLNAFISQPALAGAGQQNQKLSVGSNYFLAISEVRVADRKQVLVSLLQRENTGRIRVLQRNLGRQAILPVAQRGEEE